MIRESPFPASVLIALREYAATEHADAPEGSDPRVIWASFFALADWALSLGEDRAR